MSTTYPDLTFTNFPEAVDEFQTMLNVTASDAVGLLAYQKAMENGNVTLANEALESIENADKKIITMEKINKLANAIVALERFFTSDIQPYFSDIIDQCSNKVASLSYKGEYSTSYSYKENNIVSYTEGVSKYLYICINDANAGILPTNSYYWRQFTVRGVRGFSGDSLSFLYEWSNATSYLVNDCVTHNGIVWACVTANSNSEPSASNNNWKEVMRLHSSLYPVQSTQPTSQENGELWFEVI